MSKEKYRSLSEKTSDIIAIIVGSWYFIVLQLIAIVLWMYANYFFPQWAWDPYPYILLNFVLSFQAAFTAPIIMMSQNRQSEVDRKRAQEDYRINVIAEKEIKKIDKKIDDIKEYLMSNNN